MKANIEESHDQIIEKAISFIRSNFKSQPSLNEIAEAVHLSPEYLQKVFTEWAGISPKKFTQYLSHSYSVSLINNQLSIFDSSIQTGFSSTSRMHDLYIQIQGMTPAEFKNGAKNLEIKYQFHESPFGNIMIATTTIGICYMQFWGDKELAINDLMNEYPNANFTEGYHENIEKALSIFKSDWNDLQQIKLHLKGTDFQLQVWQALLSIPEGNLSTYSKIAIQIGNPKASRAVGTAIGSNPIAYLIPCHRVIQSSGMYGQYRWGEHRKSAMIVWEAGRDDTRNF